MSTTPNPVCPCDAVGPTPINNLPGLSQLAFRVGDFNSFRRALLTPLLPAPGQPPVEKSLSAWHSGVGAEPPVVDLAVMMVEWWAYLADILTFYNERIANEDYLRTAALPETPAALIQLLGYRPRPAIGATGTLAALLAQSVRPGQIVQLPKGLQFQSKPGPGQTPQTFELLSATQISLPDQVQAVPPPMLVGKVGSGIHGILLKGSVTSITKSMPLLLGMRDSSTAPTVVTVAAVPKPQTAANGQKQTLLTFKETPPSGLTAENSRLARANQNAALWTVNGNAILGGGKQVYLAGLARQIRPNDWILFTAPSQKSQFVKVKQVTDVLGDASSAGSPSSVSTGGTGKPIPIPVLHTKITLETALSSGLQSAPAAVSVLFDWVDVGTLLDQPPGTWNGQGSLEPVQPGEFISRSSIPILLQDTNGLGAAGSGSSGNGESLTVNWPSTTPVPLSPPLQSPIEVLYNLLPVTRGQTVANEILGSGNASVAGQSFTLAKSPVTFLSKGSGYASTIAITVNGQPWTEVASFYGRSPDAQVFITREDAQQNTHVEFGDGVNGSRLPTGTNNVVANYRVGAGASSPPAGKLTVIAQSYPGLQSVLNPVAVSGGSDADPPQLLKQYAPRSVLAFGRAVSVFDFQALAAQAPGVSMAAATWSWDAANQRAAVTVYVAGEQNVAASVNTILSAAGDPNRPVTVLPAKPLTVTLTMSFVVVTGMDTTAIQAALTSALCDAQSGLFSPSHLGIGQTLFDSQIEAACLAVDGVIGIQSSKFAVNGSVDAGPLHNPGEGAYYSLVASNFLPTFQAVSND